ncbi:ABC transporter permease [Aliarcobacter trophiarum LMG 25534]|uniref:ABC transporter permease n=1 Tax=Aliarcobacter trophiarum LMG 25534 TaxID=1032241 RepID=A0AAD0QIL1_9BACT|nr:ABC transporter permease [Aliarcobacter trophiarum]AXK48622.1 putative membrane protein [Aliarcobacter trophiarum LMG 25534]RXJ91047.1 ABC transporter permease [Aliarcobacter trophiarum LMG 25534]
MKNILKEFYKNNFIYSTKEKLAKTTIFLIIVLDIIVYMIIQEGLSFQTNFIDSPYQKYTQSCSSAMNSNYNDFSAQKYVYNFDMHDGYYKTISSKNDELDNRCKTLLEKIDSVKTNHNIKALNQTKKELNVKINKIEDDLNYIRDNYNTVLFEKIASQNSDNSILENDISSINIKEKYDTLNAQYADIKDEINKLNLSFSESNSVKDLVSYVNSIKDGYINDKNEAFSSYYYKVDFIQLAFLLPLLIGFFYLMKRYIKNEKYILYVIFKNLLIVSLIPTIYQIFSIIYKFLPKIFIEELIEFFYRLEIPFVVYYILIILFILIFTVTIIKLQKYFKSKLESNKKNKITRIKFYNISSCIECGSKVSYLNMNFCPMCRNRLNIECKNCNNYTIYGLDYCKNCGELLEV